MAKSLSKSQIAAALAEKVGITKKQSIQFMEELAGLAYKNAKYEVNSGSGGTGGLLRRNLKIGRTKSAAELRKALRLKVADKYKIHGYLSGTSEGQKVIQRKAKRPLHVKASIAQASVAKK